MTASYMHHTPVGRGSRHQVIAAIQELTTNALEGRSCDVAYDYKARRYVAWVVCDKEHGDDLCTCIGNTPARAAENLLAAYPQHFKR